MGAFGSMCQQQLEREFVSQAERNAFLESPTPRTIPKALVRQITYLELPLIRIGLFFLCIGTFLLQSVLREGNYRDQDGSLVGLGFLCCWVTCSITMVVGSLMYHRRKTRLLRDGILAFGSITNVSKPWPETTHDHRYVTVEIVNAPSSTIRLDVRPISATIATKFMNKSKPIRVLIDPKDSKHVICLELLQTLDDLLRQFAEESQRPYKYRPN